MMMKTTVTKIPVLSEKSALSIFGRVLSGERQVRIGEIVYADRVSAALDEHNLHTEGSICLHTERVSAALDEHDLHTERSICLHTERSRGDGLFSKFNSNPPCQATCISYIAPTTHTM
jgi:hypothetical protein